MSSSTEKLVGLTIFYRKKVRSFCTVNALHFFAAKAMFQHTFHLIISNNVVVPVLHGSVLK